MERKPAVASCARSRCKRAGFALPGSALALCLKHHKSLGTGRSKLERRVKVPGEARAFGSAWEAERGAELRMLEKGGAISHLAFQVSLPLRMLEGRCVCDPGGVMDKLAAPWVLRTKDSTLIERSVVDAMYVEAALWRVEDSKYGYLSPDFKRKEKWLREGYGIIVRVVHKPKARRS